MTTAPGQTPHDPIPDIPGVDHIVRALQAEGDATELVGRQAVLTMFRAARGQPAPTPPPRVQPAPGLPAYDPHSTRPLPVHSRAPGPQAPGRQRTGRPGPPRRRRVVAVAAAAVLAVCAGLTAASYAQILPDSVQNIAHSVLAPLGVPSAPSAAPVPTSPGQGSMPAATPGTSGGNGPASSAGTPGPVTAAGVSIRLVADKARVAADNRDSFTGLVGATGHPAHGVRVRLLEQLSLAAGTWRVAATGVTREDGTVILVVLHIPASATFRLAGTGKLADVISPAVTVTVIPRVLVQQPAAGILTVTAWPTAVGDTVTLLRLQNGAWVTAATSQVSAAHEARFAIRPGAPYRILLPATALHAYALSAHITAIKSVRATLAPKPIPT